MKSFPNQLIHSYSCLFYFGFPSNLATGSMRKNTEEEFFSLPTLTIFSNPGFRVRLGTPDDNWVSESVMQHDAGRQQENRRAWSHSARHFHRKKGIR